MVICPVCKTKLPFFSSPTSIEQYLKGGWTCKNCGSEIDRKGNLIKETETERYKSEYIKERARLQARKDHRKNESRKRKH